MKLSLRVLATAVLVALGCSHQSAFYSSSAAPLMQGSPLPENRAQKLAKQYPNDSTLIDMLQGFALLRSANLNDPNQLNLSKSYLEHAMAAFSDLRDPENLNVAFTSDMSIPYKGRPHERVLLASMLGVLEMADSRCDMAVSTLRNAEFLDARWQKLAYGTDSPLVYALALRCATVLNVSNDEVQRAQEGLFRTLRLAELQKPLTDLFNAVSAQYYRRQAISFKIAQLLFEVGISSSLMRSPASDSLEQIIDRASDEASKLLGVLNTQFESQYQAAVVPMLSPVFRVTDLKEQNFLALVPQELDALAAAMVARLKDRQAYSMAVLKRYQDTKRLYEQVRWAVTQPTVTFKFGGVGPSIIREGTYQEVTRIVPAPSSKQDSYIRESSAKNISLACGFHHGSQQELIVVLCDKHLQSTAAPDLSKADAHQIELWSSSQQASTVIGRRFDAILKGRAVFREGADKTVEVSAFSSWFLFNMATGILSKCATGKNHEACYAVGLGVLTAAVATAAVAAGVWVVGSTVNPAADPRYVTDLFESGWLLIP